MNQKIEIAQILDTSGARCPIPLLRTKQALKAMQIGEHLQLIATDPGTKSDIDAMLAHLPHFLVDYLRSESIVGEYPRVDTFIIRKG